MMRVPRWALYDPKNWTIEYNYGRGIFVFALKLLLWVGSQTGFEPAIRCLEGFQNLALCLRSYSYFKICSVIRW
jgi:hypothetical protein